MKYWLLCGVLLGSAAAAQAGTLLCGTKVISEGVTTAQLLATCGDPTQVDRTSIFRAVAAAGAPNSVAAMVEVHAEVWLYNFGPAKLMQRIHIEDGTVMQIESLGYGY